MLKLFVFKPPASFTTFYSVIMGVPTWENPGYGPGAIIVNRHFVRKYRLMQRIRVFATNYHFLILKPLQSDGVSL